jgi:hypothetical protein
MVCIPLKAKPLAGGTAEITPVTAPKKNRTMRQSNRHGAAVFRER